MCKLLKIFQDRNNRLIDLRNRYFRYDDNFNYFKIASGHDMFKFSLTKEINMKMTDKKNTKIYIDMNVEFDNN